MKSYCKKTQFFGLNLQVEEAARNAHVLEPLWRRPYIDLKLTQYFLTMIQSI